MGRLKKDHGGYRTSGLWTKYQQPTVHDTPLKPRAKKDTKKWCRGKVGVPHEFHQRIWFCWLDEVHYRTVCVNCRKEVSKKRVKSYPLHIEPKHSDERPLPIQVKVNGRAIPFNVCQLESLQLEEWHYCERCNKWH